MSEVFPVLGYDIGGTKIAIGLCSSDGKLYGKDRIDNKDTDPDVILPLLVERGQKLIDAAGFKNSDIKGVGIASPSPSDIPQGIIVGPPNNKHWKNVHIKHYLSKKLGIEGFFDNDANAGVLAEWFFGAGKGDKNIMYLTMSTGIGGGIVANGHLVQGRSFYAGEIGHIVLELDGIQCNCGLKGCYEAYCGGRAVAQRMQRELAGQPEHPLIKLAGGNIDNLDMVALLKGVREGNDYALKLWDETCLRNAQAFGAIMNLLNPEKLILGTIAYAAGDLFMNPVKQYLPRFAWKETIEVCEIVSCALRDDIGYYAGPAVALNCLYEAGRFDLPWRR